MIHDEAFNVGRSEDVVQVRDIAEMVREAVPGSTLSFADGAGPDLRNYKVDFSQAQRHVPGPQLAVDGPQGRRGAAAPTERHGLTLDDFNSAQFVRLRRIQQLLAPAWSTTSCAARPTTSSRHPGHLYRGDALMRTRSPAACAASR